MGQSVPGCHTHNNMKELQSPICPSDCLRCHQQKGPKDVGAKMRMIPSMTMGEYEAPRVRPQDGGLYPLSKEGTYGRVPRNKHQGRWQELPKYVPREKKPKLYASYAISDKCELHSLVLDKYSRSAPRNIRATSAPPESLARSIEKFSREQSLPPLSAGKTGTVKEEELDMVGKLELARELVEDSIESLVDGEIETGLEEIQRRAESLTVNEQEESVCQKRAEISGKKETKESFLEGSGLLLQEDCMTTYVV